MISDDNIILAQKCVEYLTNRKVLVFPDHPGYTFGFKKEGVWKLEHLIKIHKYYYVSSGQQLQLNKKDYFLRSVCEIADVLLQRNE